MHSGYGPFTNMSKTCVPHNQVFDKGTHSFIVNVQVPGDCFPSVPPSTATTDGAQAQFAISYILRCTFPSRDTPFLLNQPITVVQAPLIPDMLSPLVMADRSPLGISVNVRANRSQWHADMPATLFYSFKAPFKSDVPTVLIEILQKLALPTMSYTSTGDGRPAEAGMVARTQSVVATYALPPCYANTVTNFTVRLSPVPSLAPTMYLGPIDVDYDIRVVAVFAPSAPGASPIVEFLATTPLNILPPSQDLDIDLQFDEFDPQLPTDGTANQVPLIQVAPVVPNRFLMGGMPSASSPTSPGVSSGHGPGSGPPQPSFGATPPPQHFPVQQFMFSGPPPTGVPPMQGPIPVPPPRMNLSSPSLHPSEPDSLEARLKKAEATRDAVGPGDALPVYFAPPAPQAMPGAPMHHVSTLVEQKGAMFGGVRRPVIYLT
ncbi:hypothetical protein BC830DRAFT_466719 [Chytriomyces sp. MP71]|nr:hypothetical protein BC830DRAFT_466719 [Chytriomyces sp. MP71]